jgi:hypothetical protein
MARDECSLMAEAYIALDRAALALVELASLGMQPRPELNRPLSSAAARDAAQFSVKANEWLQCLRAFERGLRP